MTRDEVNNLALLVQDGNDLAFKELERVAKPLLCSLSYKAMKNHRKFQDEDYYSDFYSIATHALYKACLSYNERNPSFLSYAKIIINRELIRELQYWNADKRNIFTENQIVSLDTMIQLDLVYDGNIHSVIEKDLVKKIELIIDDLYNPTKAEILKRYLIDNDRVSELSEEYGLRYKNVYSIVQRGKKKVFEEYRSRFVLDNEI